MVRNVFSAVFQSGPWQTNCYLLGGAHDDGCVIVDPGVGATPGVVSVLEDSGRDPVAILLTHGHVDHVACAAELGERLGVPSYLHPADQAMLTEPALGLGPGSEELISQVLGTLSLPVPPELTWLSDGDELELAGLGFRVVLAPGHTPGSVLLLTSGDDGPVAVTGDVLFASSIGRTDLPGGSMADMVRTLSTRVLGLDDASWVLPGHGPQTTMARERVQNPYLQPEFLESV